MSEQPPTEPVSLEEGATPTRSELGETAPAEGEAREGSQPDEAAPEVIDPEVRDRERMSHPGELVRALARAARSFITYDARNETVRRMISDYRECAQCCLEAQGTVEIDVHPFELVWKGDVVYAEPDRERSLAFRLFRDGVRACIIKPDVPWEELLRLLEILSVRYVGIRQHEEDTLTLLRQADFKKIEFKVVEAYVPVEENPEGALERQASVGQITPPQDWDLPLPQLGEMVAVQYRAVPQEKLDAILAECSLDAMVAAAQQVVREVLSLAVRAKSEEVTASVLTLIEEICKYLIVELRPSELVWVLRETRGQLKDAPGVEQLAKTFSQAEVLDRFLRDPDDVVADQLMPLFSIVGGEHLDRVIDRFSREESPTIRNALKTILARLAAGKPDALLSRLGDVPTNRVVDLFNVVCVVAPVERVMEAAYSLAEHSSPEVKLGAMEVLAGAPVDARFHETMELLLACEAPRVRVKATNIYGKRGGSRAFSRLRIQLEQGVKSGLDKTEAMALGQALMLASRELARPLFRTLAKAGGVKGVLHRVKYGEGYGALRWAAASALAADATGGSREALEHLAQRAGDELAAYCREVLERTKPNEGSDG